jgi:hypothetical protein
LARKRRSGGTSSELWEIVRAQAASGMTRAATARRPRAQCVLIPSAYASRVRPQLFRAAAPLLRAGRSDPVADPKLVIFNRRLADELGLDPDVIEREAAQMLSGNRLPRIQCRLRWCTQDTSSEDSFRNSVTAARSFSAS